MGDIRSYKDLKIWQKGIQLVKQIYILTSKFPKHEQFGLTSQMRRASISVPSNIAEGYIRFSTKEYIQFLYIALGSCAELDTQLILAKELDYISDKVYEGVEEKIDHLSRMTRSLINKLRK